MMAPASPAAGTLARSQHHPGRWVVATSAPCWWPQTWRGWAASRRRPAAPAPTGGRLGPLLGFQCTAIYWVSCWSGNIAIAVTATDICQLFPALAARSPAPSPPRPDLPATALTSRPAPVCQFESGANLLVPDPDPAHRHLRLEPFDPALFRLRERAARAGAAGHPHSLSGFWASPA